MQKQQVTAPKVFTSSTSSAGPAPTSTPARSTVGNAAVKASLPSSATHESMLLTEDSDMQSMPDRFGTTGTKTPPTTNAWGALIGRGKDITLTSEPGLASLREPRLLQAHGQIRRENAGDVGGTEALWADPDVNWETHGVVLPAKTLIGNHAYSFSAVTPDNLLQFYNPWGSHQPKPLTAKEFLTFFDSIATNQVPKEKVSG